MIHLRILAGRRQTSWIFTKHVEVEYGTTEHKSIQWQEGGFEPRKSRLQVQCSGQPLGHFASPCYYLLLIKIMFLYSDGPIKVTSHFPRLDNFFLTPVVTNSNTRELLYKFRALQASKLLFSLQKLLYILIFFDYIVGLNNKL